MLGFGRLLFLVQMRINGLEFVVLDVCGGGLFVVGSFFVDMLDDSWNKEMFTLEIGTFVVLIQ